MENRSMGNLWRERDDTCGLLHLLAPCRFFVITILEYSLSWYRHQDCSPRWPCWCWWWWCACSCSNAHLLDIFLKLDPPCRLLPLPVVPINLPIGNHQVDNDNCGNDPGPQHNCSNDETNLMIMNLISLSSQKRGWGSWTPSAASPKISLRPIYTTPHLLGKNHKISLLTI